MSLPTQELTSYRASCHCGAVSFTIRTHSLADHTVNRCDCSICSRNGYLFIQSTRANVDFHTGFDSMVSYCFGNKGGAHKFCPTCGSSAVMEVNGSEGPQIYVNVSGANNS